MHGKSAHPARPGSRLAKPNFQIFKSLTFFLARGPLKNFVPKSCDLFFAEWSAKKNLSKFVRPFFCRAGREKNLVSSLKF